MTNRAVTIGAAVTAATERLRAAGFGEEEAVRDAAVIARGLLHWSLADWLAHRDQAADPAFQQALTDLTERRCRHEPVAYLLGEREFFDRPFRVQPGVLIPRPETELAVEVALEWVAALDARTVVDVGTGSGCIAVTLALEAADAGHQVAVTATDVSDVALDVARANATHLGAATITWLRCDLLADVDGPVDLVVSNPPYVPTRDRDTLSADVRDYEPGSALFAGPDGLDVIRRLVPVAAARLRPGGVLVMEVGHGQWPAVTQLLEASGFTGVDWHADLQSIPRVVAARR
jgi:release factor glutamine methyltransferase